MSLVLDPNRPWTDEEKEWARNTGRGASVFSNERRFGEDGKSEPPSGEEEGVDPESPFHDHEVRGAAVYDQGGAPLPGTTLDVDTGRVYQVDDEGNGTLVEPSLPVNTPGAFAYDSFGSVPDEGDIDDDIAEEVQAIPNMDELKKRLDKEKVDYPKSGSRADLEDALAIALHDKRHGTESHPGPAVKPVVYVDPETGEEVEKPK